MRQRATIIGLLTLTLVVFASSARAAQVSFGISIGTPPPARVVRVMPRAPGPGYVWVPGYWYPVRGRYVWREGYWTVPPYGGAVWVQPRYERGQYFEGYWLSHTDRDRDHRRFDRDRDRGRGRGHDRDRDRDRDHDRR